MIRGLEHLFYGDRLNICTYSIWRRECCKGISLWPSGFKGRLLIAGKKKKKKHLFTQIDNDRTRGNNFKMKDLGGRI